MIHIQLHRKVEINCEQFHFYLSDLAQVIRVFKRGMGSKMLTSRIVSLLSTSRDWKGTPLAIIFHPPKKRKIKGSCPGFELSIFYFLFYELSQSFSLVNHFNDHENPHKIWNTCCWKLKMVLFIPMWAFGRVASIMKATKPAPLDHVTLILGMKIYKMLIFFFSLKS